MSVSVYKSDGSLDPVAATFYRTFACTKEYFNDHKNTIPDGTIVFITDDTDEQVKEITSNVLKIYTTASELPTSGLGLQPDQYAWCIAEKAFYISSWDDESLKTIRWATVNTHWLDRVYPVGSIYINRNVETNPSNNALLGFGTWVRITGRFLYGAAAGFTVGSTGGSSTVTLGISNIPRHRHSYWITNGSATVSATTTGVSGEHSHALRMWQGGNYAYEDVVSKRSTVGYSVGFNAGSVKEGVNNNTTAMEGGNTDYQVQQVPTDTITIADVWGMGWTAAGRDDVRSVSIVRGHTHTIPAQTVTVTAGSSTSPLYTEYTGGTTSGSTQSFSILPPYLNTAIWYRSA